MTEITIEMRRETVADIVGFMRAHRTTDCKFTECIDWGADCGTFDAIMDELADRIEAAAANERACREKVLDAFRAENRRMKAALRIIEPTPDKGGAK